ncbi:hypothetical protein GGR56DRAFT_669896 [Xylariaceae sp. FL0804]|nr:hypothetical protein GGR56DRAFT_669896 [Xylariaceae sp. FL0804]
MARITAAVASLLATGAYASVGNIFADVGAITARTALEPRLEYLGHDTLETRASTTNSTFNLATWNTDTEAACQSALSTVTVATNPAGAAACYNIAQLDTTTGAFMADLRMFQISTPTGDFAGIDPQDIQGGVAYSGSTVSLVNQTVNGNLTTKRSNVGEDESVTVSRRQTNTHTLLQTYMFVGQINKNEISNSMTLFSIEPLIMPTVTLSAKNTAGQTVRTQVAANQAVFVNGVFSQDVVLSDFAKATLAVQNVTDALSNGTIAFIVPGVNLLIFPVGLVVTGVWALLGFAAYGFGSYERYGHAESYKRRMAMSSKATYARI